MEGYARRSEEKKVVRLHTAEVEKKYATLICHVGEVTPEILAGSQQMQSRLQDGTLVLTYRS